MRDLAKIEVVVKVRPEPPKYMVGGPDGKGLDCKSIALKSSVFDSRTDLQVMRM